MAFQTFDQWKQQTEPKVTTTVQSFDDWKKSTNPLNEGLLAPIGRAIQKVPESFVGGLAGKGIRNIGKSFEQLASSKGRQEFMQTNPIMQQFEKAGRAKAKSSIACGSPRPAFSNCCIIGLVCINSCLPFDEASCSKLLPIFLIPFPANPPTKDSGTF